MASGFKINKSEIAKMQRELQREFNKRPITIPVRAERPRTTRPFFAQSMDAEPEATNIYNGPVFNGDMTGARIAFGNSGDVSQGDSTTEQVTPGFEALAELLTKLIPQLPAFGLEEDEAVEAATVATEILAEIVEEEPDAGVVRRGLRSLKGILAPVAIKSADGAGDGASELARDFVSGLNLPF